MIFDVTIEIVRLSIASKKTTDSVWRKNVSESRIVLHAFQNYPKKCITRLLLWDFIQDRLQVRSSAGGTLDL